ncbi:MAG TPA: hypothetical protein PLY87_07710 [Planctomycetaceae bacterium]|nr:hypothetical protein [Planctomycetaceae bacterium]HQZ64945.1 hypothetical protein [Planctomycetaceae bacterium]
MSQSFCICDLLRVFNDLKLNAPITRTLPNAERKLFAKTLPAKAASIWNLVALQTAVS